MSRAWKSLPAKVVLKAPPPLVADTTCESKESSSSGKFLLHLKKWDFISSREGLAYSLSQKETEFKIKIKYVSFDNMAIVTIFKYVTFGIVLQ